ncbi:hypothetical protein [uncultured Tessaracoccus sp.]|uniref:hypothetical protein n=1 Tax=uncultured Tessaracoccus sp. TaxID=905023 RepID=UPI0025E69C37|nr:hypothetical protein [uncultured Tessaracoccus sp.]
MDTTMIRSEDPTLHVGLVEASVWADAVERIRDGAVPRDDEDQLAFWEAAGILDGGLLDQGWGQALRVVQTSEHAVELLSRYDDVAFAVTVFVDADWSVACTSRATVGTVDGVEAVDRIHPMLEVALTPRHRVWQLVRRSLPPLDELRHEPRPTRLDDATRVDLSSIPDEMRATPETFAAHLYQLPQLPPELVDATDPRATVFTYGVRATPTGVQTSNKTWILGRALTLVDADTASMWQVRPGDLGAALTQFLLA